MFRWRRPASASNGLVFRGLMRSGLMGTVAERHTKGREAVCTASRPLAYVCTRGAVPGSWSCLRVLSQCLVLQVCDCFVSAHVLISHEFLDAVGVHVHVFLAAQGTDFSTDTVGDFTLNAVAHV